MIRVLVKASSAIVRAGLESLLGAHRGFHLVPYSAGSEATDDASEAGPDVLVVEAETLSDTSAREALDWASDGAPVILLVRDASSDAVAEALQAGVKAVLPNVLTAPELAAAIEAAAQGLIVLDDASLKSLLRPLDARPHVTADEPVETLTPREIEVLRLLASGLGNKEVASRLEISEHTAKFHVASIMGKLGAGSRTEAVTLGIRQGLS